MWNSCLHETESSNTYHGNMSTRHDSSRRDAAHSEREPLTANPSDPSRTPKEESIRRKIRTYEAILALRAGYMPTTEQFNQWVRYALQNSGVLDARNRRLSAPGRQLVRDLRAWIESVADAAEQKNVCNIFLFCLPHC